jgi:hypothetical protein
MMHPEHQAAYSKTVQTMRGMVCDLNHLLLCIKRGETVENLALRIEAIANVTASKTTEAANDLYWLLQDQSAQDDVAGMCAEVGESRNSAE